MKRNGTKVKNQLNQQYHSLGGNSLYWIAFKKLTIEEKQVAYEWHINDGMVSSIWVFIYGNPVQKSATAPPHTCTLSPEKKKKLWSKLFNIFLELFFIPVLVSYGMHFSHTSKYDHVYMLNREANLYTNLKNNTTV